jgi:hypothetical protein
MFNVLHDGEAPVDTTYSTYIVLNNTEQTPLGTLYNITSKYKTDDIVGVLHTKFGEWYVASETSMGLQFHKAFTKRHQAIMQYVRDAVEGTQQIVEVQEVEYEQLEIPGVLSEDASSPIK